MEIFVILSQRYWKSMRYYDNDNQYQEDRDNDIQ